jgi:hypothetical protein
MILFRRFLQQFPEFRIVDCTHIRETGAFVIVIRTDQRIGDKAGNMVGDQRKASDLIMAVDAAGRVGEEQDLRAERMHDTRGKDDLINGIALVIMHTALHADDRNIVYIADQETADMPRYRGKREAREIMVGNLRLHFDMIAVAAEAGTERECHARYDIGLFTDDVCAFLDCTVHVYSFSSAVAYTTG